MTKQLLQTLVLAAACIPCLWGLSVKVLSVDHKAGEITVLLPMHNAHVRPILTPDEPEIRVRLNEFYEARLIEGQVDTVKRNILRISIPEHRPVFFRVHKVTFLEK
jgi:hypothetical protein